MKPARRGGKPRPKRRSRNADLPAPGRRRPSRALFAGAVLILIMAACVGIWRTQVRADGGARAGREALLLPPASSPPPFDGKRAYEILKKQVSFGPRVPGHGGHDICRDYLVAQLKPLADEVSLQDCSIVLDRRKVPMENVIARWKPKEPGGVLLCAHWDTRPTADQETDPARRRLPIPGANDGASGVAVLLELAQQFKKAPPPVPVWLALFDGEDYGPGIDRMFLGARYFANHLPAGVPQVGILLDMIGDRDLEIPEEPNSMRAAPAVVRDVYQIAAKLGHSREFPARPGPEIEDDHLPLIEKGLQVIDLIDFTYPAWHTLADTPDKCSAQSLQTVGDVLSAWVYSRR